MGIIARMLFVLFLVVAPIVVWTTSASLPARVATHFGGGGLANGWMTHDGYIAFMIMMTTLLPLVIVLVTGLVPRFATSRISLRNREFWLSPKRREATVSTLAALGCAMGVLLIVFLVGIHFLVLEANTRSPARLDESAFLVVLVGFLVLLALWIGALAVRFGRAR